MLMGCLQATWTRSYMEADWLSKAPWTMTGKKGLKEERHFKSQITNAKCVRAYVFLSVHSGVGLLCNIKMPVNFFSLCTSVCVCCSPLCSCDP